MGTVTIGSGGLLPAVLAEGSNLIGAVSQTVASVTTATLQNAVSATGNGASLDVSGKSVAVINITGTFAAVISFEVSTDDANWYPINATQLGADALSTTATAPGLYRLSVGGIKSVRARVTWTSGTSVTAIGRSTLADSHAKVVAALPQYKELLTLLSAVTTNQTSAAVQVRRGRRTLQASIAGTGAVSATVTWYGNNLNAASGGIAIATSTLSGTTTDQSGADIPAEWPYLYAVLTGISGTGAAVTATVGV